eukprot:1353793-Karenia_brevis.AAC.1
MCDHEAWTLRALTVDPKYAAAADNNGGEQKSESADAEKNDTVAESEEAKATDTNAKDQHAFLAMGKGNTYGWCTESEKAWRAQLGSKNQNIVKIYSNTLIPPTSGNDSDFMIA